MPGQITYEAVPGVPDALVLAVARHAERQADLTSTYLRGSDLCPTGEIRLPAAALLELAAVLEIGRWERHGLRPHVSCDLPSYDRAADEFAARCEKGPAEFEGSDATPLARQVLRIWVEYFAWDAPEMLDAEVVLGGINEEDQFIDLLAQFVWTHRNELRRLASE